MKKRIHFNEVQFSLESSKVIDATDTLNQGIALFNKVGVGKVNESDFPAFYKDAEAIIKTRLADQVNQKSKLGLLGLKVKAKNLWNLLDTPEEVSTFLQFYDENIKPVSFHEVLPLLEWKSGKFAIKENTLETIEENNSLYIDSSKDLAIHAEYEKIVDSLNKIASQTSNQGIVLHILELLDKDQSGFALNGARFKTLTTML